MKRLLFIIVSLAFLFANTNIWAVPSLGVGAPRTYFQGLDPDGNVEPPEEYQDWFADGFASGAGSIEGFSFMNSGDTLSVWTNILTDADGNNVDIWLMAENAFGSGLSFGGESINTNMDTIFGTDQIDGYTSQPYFGLNLLSVLDSSGNPNTGWEALPGRSSDPQGPWNPEQFYVFERELTFSGELPIGNYLFAAADYKNPNGKIGGKEFSMKTTSAVAVPEPSTMLILGAGIILGLGLYGRRRRKK